jgi:succinoglycan biosynthesis protein ExoM
VSVAICVITYKRSESLGRLLRSLAGLRFDGPPPEIRLVVVDNDPRGSAKGDVEESRKYLPWEVSYTVESRHGIPHARNTAIHVAEGCEVFAFIDDDEAASPGWLKGLLKVHERFGAELVAGPVLPAFEGTAPEWLRKSQLFDRSRRPTGTPLPFAGTGNLLIDASVIRAFGEPFDARLATIGGSDTLFTMQAVKSGFSLVWSDDALVTEWLPSERATLQWLVRRAFRGGSGFTKCEAIVYPGLRRRLRRAALALFRQLRGVIEILVGIVTARPERVAFGLRRASTGVGMLLGLLGIRYQEYRRR